MATRPFRFWFGVLTALPLDTLAQLGQRAETTRGEHRKRENTKANATNGLAFFSSAGPRPSAPNTELKPNPRETLLKRARAKFLSRSLATALATVNCECDDLDYWSEEHQRWAVMPCHCGKRSPLEQSYRNTTYCADVLAQRDGQISGSYCGNRWCMVCNRIRTARAIIRYLPVVEALAGPVVCDADPQECPGRRAPGHGPRHGLRFSRDQARDAAHRWVAPGGAPQARVYL